MLALAFLVLVDLAKGPSGIALAKVWSRRNAQAFEEAARLPFEEDPS